MGPHLRWFVFGLMLAQAAWAASSRYFEDLTYADAIKMSEKCSRCTPGRPCMMEAMPKLPVKNNYDLDYVEFLTDDELNAKYKGEKNFCDCTADLWGGDFWRETPTEGCGAVFNDLCTVKKVCGKYPCSAYALGTYDCLCPKKKDWTTKQGQFCDWPLEHNPLKYYTWRPSLAPFMYSPTFAPYQAMWFRGLMINHAQIGETFCERYTFDDGRDFCATMPVRDDPKIWYYVGGEPYKQRKKQYARKDCLEDVDKKIHYLNRKICEMIPDGNVHFVFVPHDHWFRVDLNPANPDTVMIPGDPLPVGRKFRMRLISTVPFNRVLNEQNIYKTNVSWLFNHGYPEPEPLNLVALYQLHFRQCTFIFTYTGCSLDQKTQPTYDQNDIIVIRASRQKHPGTNGCKTMEVVDNRWTAETGTDTFYHPYPYSKFMTGNIETVPMSPDHSKGIEEEAYTYKLKNLWIYDWKWRNVRLGLNKLLVEFTNMVITHDFVQQGHPRKHVSTEMGLQYQTRNLCYFKYKYSFDIIRPKFDYVSQNCNDKNDLVLEITKPFYFWEPLRIEWRCLNPIDPSDPCTKVQLTGSKEDRFLLDYKDFRYSGPLQCHDYVWTVKVILPIRSKEKKYYYHTVIVERSLNYTPVSMESLTVSNRSMVNPDEPNFFAVETDPPYPHAWSWTLWKVNNRTKNGTLVREEVVGDFQQPLTSTYICIIPPNTLVQDTEYLLIAKSPYGKSSSLFTANSPPKNGKCAIEPKTGTAGVTKFTVRCENYTDGQEPLSVKVVESEGLDEMPWSEYTSVSIMDAAVREVKVYDENLAALIFDREGMYTRVPLVNVTLNDPPPPPEDIIPRREKTDQDKVGSIEDMAQYTRHFDRLGIRFTDKQKVAYIDALSKRGMMVLRNMFITNGEKNPKISGEVIEAGGEQLDKFAEIFKGPTIQENMNYYDQVKLRTVFIYITSSILQHQDRVILKNEVREDVHEAHKIRASRGCRGALEALDDVGKTTRKKQFYQLQPTLSLKEENITMLAQTNNATTFNEEFSPERIKDHTMTLSKTATEKYKGRPVFSVMISSKEDLFWWLPNDAGILSVMAEVKEKNGKWVKADGPFNIYLRLKYFKNKTETLTGVLKPQPKCITSLRLDRSVSVHHLKLPEGEGVVYMVFPKDLVGRVKVSAGSKKWPSHGQVKKSQVLSTGEITVGFSNLDSRNRSDFYIGVLYSVESASVPVPYKIEYKIIRCGTYVYSQFEFRGCQFVRLLESKTDSPRIECQCSHLSWFSASISFPPHRRLLTKEDRLYSTVVDNLYVALLVALMLLLFLFLLIWGYKKDREDRKNRFVKLLDDNWCNDSHPYVVAVFTGKRFNSGTTSQVSIRVFGNKEHSRVHLFPPFVLNTGLDSWFLMKTHKPLGQLTKIQLWHNPAGYSPDWYCHKVIIYDLKLEESNTFLVDRWFTFDHAVSLSDARMFEVALLKRGEKSNRWQYYIAGWVISELREKHIWASVFIRHPRSWFTRNQRAAIAFGFIMTTMVFSMLFFDFQPGPSDLFSLEFNWNILWHGVLSACIAAILQLVVVFFFMQSKETMEEKESSLKHDSSLYQQPTEASDTLSNGKEFEKKDKKRNLMKALLSSVIIRRSVVVGTMERPTRKGRRIIFFLAWILASAIILTCSALLINYGLEFGRNKSIVWILSFTSGVLTEAIIFEPLKIILLAGIIFLLFKKSKGDTIEMEVRYDEVDEKDEDWITCLYRMLLIRLDKPYHPALTSGIVGIRSRHPSRRVCHLIYYGIISVLSLVIACLFVYAFGVEERYYGLRQINSHFQEESEKLDTKQKMYQFIHHNVTPALHRAFWYSGKPLPLEVSNNTGLQTMGSLYIAVPPVLAVMLNDKSEPLAGGFEEASAPIKGELLVSTLKTTYPQILDLIPDVIKIPKVFENQFSEAYGHYYELREDKESYLPGWLKYDSWSGNISQLWRYSDIEATNTGHSFGKSGWLYSGAGYVVPLTWNKGDSWRILQALEMYDWATNRTRAVFFEANIYNNFLQLYTELRFIIEAMPTGAYESRMQLRTTSFCFQNSPEAQMMMILTACLALVLLGLGFLMFLRISRNGFKAYFSDSRAYLDLLVISIGLSCVTDFITRTIEISVSLQELLEAPHQVYTSLYAPFNANESAHIVLGAFTLVATLLLVSAVYQAFRFKKFHFVLSNVLGPLIVLICVNIAVSNITRFESYTLDRDPLQNVFLHSALRDQSFLEKDDDLATRILYVIVMPLFIILLKFNVGCIIYLHLWFTEVKVMKPYTRVHRKKRGKIRRRQPQKSLAYIPIRLKGKSWTSQGANGPSEDVWLLKIQKLKASSISLQ